MDWYYIKDGQQVGPEDDPTFSGLARQGKIGQSDRVWNAAMGSEWGYAADVPGLFPAAAPARHQAPDRIAGSPSGCGATPNASLTEQARAALQGRWWMGAGAALLVTLLPLPLGFIPVIGTLAAYAVSPQLQLGWTGFALRIARRDGQLDVGRVFDGFHNYWKALGLFLLSNLYILLWTLLLIIPGIMEGSLATGTPASPKALTFSSAVPEPLEMIAPAWPIRFPGGAVCPAIKATTGLVIFSRMNLAACSSASPPISPISTTASVFGSSSNI